jgi:hypothetical protein
MGRIPDRTVTSHAIALRGIGSLHLPKPQVCCVRLYLSPAQRGAQARRSSGRIMPPLTTIQCPENYLADVPSLSSQMSASLLALV